MSGPIHLLVQVTLLAAQIALAATCDDPATYGHGFFHGVCVMASAAFTFAVLSSLRTGARA